ncbi:MAG: hypothetical protein QM658_17645 [Gordonia sp. (in: high G+C Gram-positive bacteria)]
MPGFKGWNLAISQFTAPFLGDSGPATASGEMKFGHVTQTATAFGAIQDGLSFFRTPTTVSPGGAAIIRCRRRRR